MAPNLNADALRLWTCDLDTLFGEWHIKLNDGVTKKALPKRRGFPPAWKPGVRQGQRGSLALVRTSTQSGSRNQDEPLTPSRETMHAVARNTGAHNLLNLIGHN